MSTAVAHPERMNVAAFFKAADKSEKAISFVNFTKQNEDGTGTFEKLPIFRAGTFKDSLGIQHTWEPEHLQQMVFNYELLKGRGTFPHVPIRSDHSFSVNSVIGWIEGLSVEDGTLYAAGDITEPDAAGKIARGTYRYRSAEIGMYETNDEVLYWPVLMGFAFVDMAAVEGLFANSNHAHNKFTLLTDQEDTLSTETMNKTHTFQIAGQPTTDFGAVQAHIAKLEAAAEAHKPATFRVNGVETTDHASVQTHLTALEGSLAEIEVASRTNFVKALATDKKIGATQIDSMTKHALDLTPEQFASFKSMYENAPVVPALGAHGDGVTNPDNDNANGGEPTELETLEEMVKMSKRAGLTDEAVRKTPSWNKLQELKGSK